MAAFTYEFSCDYCFNDGKCENNTNICTGCAEGYGQDFDWYHFPNCVRPKNAAFIYFICYCCQIVFLFALTINTYRKLESEAKRVCSFFIFILFLLFSLTLSLYLQDGCFEGCAIFANSAIFSLTYFTRTIILFVMKPLFHFKVDSFERFQYILTIWTIIISIAPFPTLLGMIILCRDFSRIFEYNLISLFASFHFYAAGLIQLSLIIRAATKLRKELNLTMETRVVSLREAPIVNSEQITGNEETPKRKQTGISNESLAGLIQRLQFLRIGAAFVAVQFFFLLVATPVCWYFFGSIPYSFVISYLIYDCILPFGLGMVLFLKRNNIRKSMKISTRTVALPTLTMNE